MGELGALAGLVLLVYAVVFFDEKTPFPGRMALVAVLALPSLTKSSLADMGDWVDWAFLQILKNVIQVPRRWKFIQARVLAFVNGHPRHWFFVPAQILKDVPWAMPPRT